MSPTSVGIMFRLLYALALLATFAKASRIIIFAGPGCYTHHRGLQALGQEIVVRGHNVLVREPCDRHGNKLWCLVDDAGVSRLCLFRAVCN